MTRARTTQIHRREVRATRRLDEDLRMESGFELLCAQGHPPVGMMQLLPGRWTCTCGSFAQITEAEYIKLFKEYLPPWAPRHTLPSPWNTSITNS
ncbi:hypothetical protein [Streptomyces sp. NPDC057910]|uniref:hypothetical protein n=1 Tax=Streptomyces sp. NPDC057910 TaxID=3346278 RepID=UPI0036F157E7